MTNPRVHLSLPLLFSCFLAVCPQCLRCFLVIFTQFFGLALSAGLACCAAAAPWHSARGGESSAAFGVSGPVVNGVAGSSMPASCWSTSMPEGGVGAVGKEVVQKGDLLSSGAEGVSFEVYVSVEQRFEVV